MRKCILLLFLFNGFSSLGLWSSNIYVNGSTYFIGPNANLVEANLSGADLRDAWLNGADLTSANLTEANLSNAQLSGTILSNAILRDVNFQDAYIGSAVLTHADLTGSDFSDVTLNNALFSYTTLAQIKSGGISGTPQSLPTDYKIMSGYILGPNVDLSNENLTSIDFSTAVLTLSLIHI